MSILHRRSPPKRLRVDKVTHPSFQANSWRGIYHDVLFENSCAVPVSLPLVEIPIFHNGKGRYPIAFNPQSEKKSCIVGMFVVRPGERAWMPDDRTTSESLYNVSDWVYNIKGRDSGGLISQSDVVDGFRLALQYGLSDAVIVSSRIAASEGVTTNHPVFKQGYIWQPYFPLSWPSIQRAAASSLSLRQMISRQRTAFQNLGYLSPKRAYPSLVIFTVSGERHPNAKHDFLDADVFKAKHSDHAPESDCSPIEVYILTSVKGAHAIRKRVMMPMYSHLQSRLEDILIICSPPNNDAEVDLEAIPKLLFERFDMRLVNHDGGKHILHNFASSGALHQMNMTFCRNKSMMTILKQEDSSLQSSSSDKLPTFEYYFDQPQSSAGPEEGSNIDISCQAGHPWLVPTKESDDCSAGSVRRGVYRSWLPIMLLGDRAGNVAIVSFLIPPLTLKTT